MSTHCEQCRQWIKEQLVGELSDEDRSQMEAHLEVCPACNREHVILERTLDRLHELRDESPPRHFFVYEDDRRQARPGRWISPSAWGWKTVFAGVAAVLVAAVLVLGQTRLDWDQGRFTLSFGSGPLQGTSQTELRPELIEAVRSVIREENQKWADGIRQELEISLSEASEENRQTVRSLAAALELKLDRKLEAQDAAGRELLQVALQQWGHALAIQRQSDLEQIRQVLTQFADNDRIQADKSSAIMATLVQIADSSNSRGGSR